MIELTDLGMQHNYTVTLTGYIFCLYLQKEFRNLVGYRNLHNRDRSTFAMREFQGTYSCTIFINARFGINCVLAPFPASFQARSHFEFNYPSDSNYLSPLFIQTPHFPDHNSMPTLRESTVHAYSAQKFSSN